MRLSDLGMKESDLERAARIATEAPYPNPRKVEYAPVLELLRSAYQGRALSPCGAVLSPAVRRNFIAASRDMSTGVIAARGTITV